MLCVAQVGDGLRPSNRSHIGMVLRSGYVGAPFGDVRVGRHDCLLSRLGSHKRCGRQLVWWSTPCHVFRPWVSPLCLATLSLNRLDDVRGGFMDNSGQRVSA
jgi:hypothetical protein